MKKLLSLLTALLFLFACSEDREQVLKVYSWADYIDEDLLGEFETWYEEQTGETVKVLYQTFDINETMLSKIELGHEDYDLVCPSDYIIERMLQKDLLLPIDRDFGDTPNYTDSIAPFIVNFFDQIQGYGKNANDYSVAYMWGTVGMIYNTKYVDESQVQSWNILTDPKYSGQILMKDAFRDIYTALLVYLNKDALASGEKRLEDITLDASDESIALVENYISTFRNSIAGWEADFGKEQMTQERAWLNVSWSGDAQWAINETEGTDVHLKYSIPRDGSIIWFDGWVIPKYARNVKAARYFIDFMCRPDNAVRNMDVIGYVSAVGGSEILESMTDEKFPAIDATYFFGPQADSVCLNPVMYPDRSVIEACGMMHDSGDRTEALLKMWSRLKGDNASYWTYILIAVVLVGLGFAMYSRFAKKKGHRRKPAARKRR
jgi:spermidine/putrescine transport system substrate-binding protein